MINSLAGYGSSIVLLAVASLVVIPEMIRADGLDAWGSIAVGQAIGTVAAVVLAYGWQISGPALVARSDAAVARRELHESVVLKLFLFPVVATAAALVAWSFAGASSTLAATGAISTSSIGLTAQWYFVGLGRPYVFLAVETVPRVAGTALGILAMRSGQGAIVGVLFQLGGMVLGAIISTCWAMWSTRNATGRRKRRSLSETIRRQAHGLTASVASAFYVSAPLMIVSTVAPPLQATYALIDKVQRQLGVALGPAVAVLQGWVPRASRAQRQRRAAQALAISACFSTIMGTAVAVTGSYVLNWVSGGQAEVGARILILMGVFVGLVLFESSVARAVLPALDRLDVVAKQTTLSAFIGLPLVAFGATISIEAALGGLVLGLIMRTSFEVHAAISPILSGRFTNKRLKLKRRST